MIGYPCVQDRAILPARDCPFRSNNKISPRSKRGHGSFLSQNIFCDSKEILHDFSVGMELENEKTKSVNENENKENKNVDRTSFKTEDILRQNPANTNVKSESDLRAWNGI